MCILLSCPVVSCLNSSLSPLPSFFLPCVVGLPIWKKSMTRKFRWKKLREIITSRVKASGDPMLTGICCVNMDGNVRDERVKEIYRIAEQLREERAKSKEQRV